MSANIYDLNKIQEAFARYLTEKSLRKSTVRDTILKHICDIRGHFDVEMLLVRLEEHNFHVSRASIYNMIELLMDAGMVVRHQFTPQLVQYELKCAAATHMHVVCTYCGAVKECKNDKLASGITSFKIAKFTHEYHTLYIYGMCSKCKFRMNLQRKCET
ncbi:MAG: transcriptional repressor [Tannerella sp.]|jgi:Fur family ferric uptake transcriptional regulator|nr:transcriptional repressor [Tannerella sp.]